MTSTEVDALKTARNVVMAALAVQRAHRDDPTPRPLSVTELLDMDGLRNELRQYCEGEIPDVIVTRLAIRAARSVLAVWEGAFPELTEPERAVTAAERWASAPTAESAQAARVVSEKANAQALSRWHSNKIAAWAARAASWAALGPAYSWASVAAIVGAVNATSIDFVVGELARYLEHK